VAPREPRSPLLHTHALHARLLPGRRLTFEYRQYINTDGT
jgi:hypothetical protein